MTAHELYLLTMCAVLFHNIQDGCAEYNQAIKLIAERCCCSCGEVNNLVHCLYNLLLDGNFDRNEAFVKYFNTLADFANSHDMVVYGSTEVDNLIREIAK